MRNLKSVIVLNQTMIRVICGQLFVIITKVDVDVAVVGLPIKKRR